MSDKHPTPGSDGEEPRNVGATCFACQSQFVTASDTTTCPFCGEPLRAFQSLEDERHPDRPWETP